MFFSTYICANDILKPFMGDKHIKMDRGLLNTDQSKSVY
jgi:hypothetical protein